MLYTSLLGVAVTALLAAQPALAGKAAVQLAVSAQVADITRITAISQPGSVVITAQDIQRGYVEVRDGTSLSVRSNGAHGYYLVFEAEPAFHESVSVMDQGRMVRLAGGRGLLHQSSPGSSSTRKTLGFRFTLSSDTKPGMYAWPVRVTSAPE